MRNRYVRYPGMIAMAASLALFRTSYAASDPEQAILNTELCEAVWDHLMSQVSPRGNLHLILEETQTPIPHPDHGARVREAILAADSRSESSSVNTSKVFSLSSEERYALTLERVLRPKVYRREVGLSDKGYTLTTKEIVPNGARPDFDEMIVARFAEDGELTGMCIDHLHKRIFPCELSQPVYDWWNLGTFSWDERGMTELMVDALEITEKEQEGASALDPPGRRLCSSGALAGPSGSLRISTEAGGDTTLTRLNFDCVLTGPIVVLTKPENWAQVVSRRVYSIRDPERLVREEEFYYAATSGHDHNLVYPERVVRKLHGETHPGVRSIAEIKVTPSYAEAPEMMDFDDLKKKFPDYSFAE